MNTWEIVLIALKVLALIASIAVIVLYCLNREKTESSYKIFENTDFVSVKLYRYAKDGRYGETLTELKCVVFGLITTIPKGFRTDFASIPRCFYVFLTPIGKHTLPAILHDYLYAVGHTLKITRKQADKIFLAGMKECGVNTFARFLMYFCVRAFGAKFYKKG